jgi:hypothetical protein
MTLKEFMDRYGPSVAVLASLIVLAALVVQQGGGGEAGPEDVSQVAASGGSSADGSAEGTDGVGGDVASGGDGSDSGSLSTNASGSTVEGAGGLAGPAATGRAASALPGASAPGVKFGSGPNCRPDGRQNQIWLYAPVCVEPWVPGTDNGGATAKGVTRDKVLIVRFIPQVDPATQAALRGINAEDLPEDQKRIYETLRLYMNAHTETYGREVVVQDVGASGPTENEEAMKADAIKVASEIKPLAVFGQTLSHVFAAELAQRGVPCVCVRSQSKGYYKRNPSLIFGDLPTIEDYYTSIAEYVGKRLAGKPAKWSGDPTQQMQRTPRKFGLIYYEGVRGQADPDMRRARDFFISELRKYNVSLATDVGYLYELQQAGDQSAQIMARMKDAGVSNLIFIGDPLYPIFLTKEATRQGYFPEWFISGTLLSDTTLFGRTYDQQQWSHAFGMSPLWVFFEDVSKSYGYRMYHHMRPGSRRGDEGVGINVYASPVQTLFGAIQMAGPRLTPESFAEALFRAPPLGGKPAAPLVFFTKESPNAIKDFTEVWWNPNGRGKDEAGNEGVGILMKANGGRRYKPGEWPVNEPNAFDANGAVFTSDNLPGGSDTYPHETTPAPHTHDLRKRCMSCS